MDIKDHLQKVPELNPVKYSELKTDAELENYVKELNEFIDSFPVKEAELRAALERQDTAAVSAQILDLYKTLVNIYADELAEECWKHASNFINLKFERINAYVTYFISTMAALSIDIQMALFMDENKGIMEQAPASTNAEKVILAVDDDAFCLDMLKRSLQDVRCKIIGVTNGSAALNILRTQKPDVFVFDIEMPTMTGIELAGKIRSLGFRQPIVFITGNADKNYVISAVRAGGVEFILKPISPQNVVTRISKFL
jgi:CheY-like chemotaxis protein/HPt (histidine-containing phosphotransfer) domain-containing protein